MGKSDALDPLQKTLASLKEIRANLLPFIQLLKEDDDAGGRRGRKRGRTDDSADGNADHNTSSDSKASNGSAARETNDQPTKLTPHRRAEAEAAVSLALGTLRYMGARLRGLDRGRKKGDPLRAELDKMRGLLVALRKLEEGKKTEGEEKDGAKKDDGGLERKKEGIDSEGGEGASPSKKQRKA